MCVSPRHKSSISDSWGERPAPFRFTFSPPNMEGLLAWEQRDLTSIPVFLQFVFSQSSWRCCNAADVNREAFEGAEPSPPSLPVPKSASRKPAVGLGKREEVIFYIRAVNHSSVSCIFPMVVWLAEQLAERTEEECVVELAPALRG